MKNYNLITWCLIISFIFTFNFLSAQNYSLLQNEIIYNYSSLNAYTNYTVEDCKYYYMEPFNTTDNLGSPTKISLRKKIFDNIYQINFSDRVRMTDVNEKFINVNLKYADELKIKTVTHTLTGVLIGLTLGAIIGTVIGNSYDPKNSSNSGTLGSPGSMGPTVLGKLIGGVIGTLAGALIGGSIGSQIYIEEKIDFKIIKEENKRTELMNFIKSNK